MTGIVYCLENPAMPGLVKIGRAQDIEQRLRSLDNTSIPLPFVCVVAMEVDDAAETEQLLHDVFSDHRVRPSREFFEVDAERVAAALRLTRGLDVTPKCDVVEDEETQVALDKARRRRENFNFEMVDIETGAELRFHYRDIFNDGEPYIAEVVSKNKIRFDGQETSLSAAATSIMQEHGLTGPAAGPRYWHYEGEALNERRRRMDEDGD